jgi:hypothetical protein
MLPEIEAPLVHQVIQTHADFPLLLLEAEANNPFDSRKCMIDDNSNRLTACEIQ